MGHIYYTLGQLAWYLLACHHRCMQTSPSRKKKRRRKPLLELPIAWLSVSLHIFTLRLESCLVDPFGSDGLPPVQPRRWGWDAVGAWPSCLMLLRTHSSPLRRG